MIDIIFHGLQPLSKPHRRNSPRPDTRLERSVHDHDLDDFVAFTDEEIAAIAAFLHEERETASPVVPDETDTQEEDDIDWDGEDDIGQAAATPPNIISAFKQTGLHASEDRSHGALVMSVDLESARKLDCERATQESQRQQVQINIKP
jgi:hypothetical protein